MQLGKGCGRVPHRASRATRGYAAAVLRLHRTVGHMPSRPVPPERSLAPLHPEIASQWDTVRNGALRADEVFSHSKLSVWWRCPVADDHVWQAPIKNRVVRRDASQQCPACRNMQLSTTNSLATLHPHLADQLDPDLNDGVDAHHVIAGGHRQLWWRCPAGPDHIWSASIANRIRRGSGCPFCAGQRASVTNNLLSPLPDLAALFDVERNAPTTPAEVPAGSSKRYWWRCPAGPDHLWQTSVNDLRNAHASGRYGCPACSSVQVSVTNSLQTRRPDVAAQLDPDRNGGLTADEVTVGSSSRLWWRCAAGPDHRWQASPATRQHSGCPFCAERKACSASNLSVRFPEVAAEFDPAHNGDLTTISLRPFSARKVWWLCRNGHRWRASVCNRTRQQTGCPECGVLHGRSRQEIRLAYELAAFLDFDPDDIHEPVHGAGACDITIVPLCLVVEWDGAYWHTDGEDRDRRKLATLTKHGWTVVRLREAPLRLLGPHDVAVPARASDHARAVLALRAVEAASGQTIDGLEGYEQGGRCVASADAQAAIDRLTDLAGERAINVPRPDRTVLTWAEAAYVVLPSDGAALSSHEILALVDAGGVKDTSRVVSARESLVKGMKRESAKPAGFLVQVTPRTFARRIDPARAAA